MLAEARETTAQEVAELYRADALIYIPPVIEARDLRPAMKRLHDLEKEKEGGRVLVEVNTHGGIIKEALDFAQAMRSSKLQVATFVTHRCMSAGVLIAAAGTPGHRYAYGNSEYMMHPPVLDGVELHAQAHEGLAEIIEYRSLVEQFYASLGEYTGFPAQRWRDEFRGDVYFNSLTASSMGLVDRILLKPLKGPAVHPLQGLGSGVY